MSEKGSEPDFEARRFNVAEVPEPDIPCLTPPLAITRDTLGLLPLLPIRLGRDQRLSALHSFKQVTSKEHQIAQ